MTNFWNFICSHCDIKTIEVIVATIFIFGEIFVLYLTRKMYRFAKQYSRQWGNAFLVFGIGMILSLARRFMVLLWALGLDGKTGAVLQWIDHVAFTAILTIIWAVFLLMLLKWWKVYFAKYERNAGLTVEREDIVSKREDLAADREGLVTKREDVVKRKENR